MQPGDKVPYNQPIPQPVIPNHGTGIPGYMPGIFPRHHIITGENILWEGRPSLLPYLIKPIIYLILSIIYLILSVILWGVNLYSWDALWNIVITSFILWILILYFGYPWSLIAFLIDLGLFPIILYTPSTSLLILPSLIYLIFAFIAIFIAWMEWRHTYYAASDRRIMAQYGVFSIKFADLPHDKIQNSTVLMPFWERIFGYGTIVFATAGIIGGINPRQSAKMMSVGGAIVWRSVMQPAILHRHIQEIIRASLEKMKVEEYRRMAEMFQGVGAMQGKGNVNAFQSELRQNNQTYQNVQYQRTITCKRCGYTYTVTTPPGQATKCPRCGYINY